MPQFPSLKRGGISLLTPTRPVLRLSCFLCNDCHLLNPCRVAGPGCACSEPQFAHLRYGAKMEEDWKERTKG